jgi:hypothetical protein
MSTTPLTAPILPAFDTPLLGLGGDLISRPRTGVYPRLDLPRLLQSAPAANADVLSSVLY